jgi:hypothetical protein
VLPIRKSLDSEIRRKKNKKLRHLRINTLHRDEKKLLRGHVERELKSRMLKVSKTASPAPVTFMRKADTSKRLVVDYWQLNRFMVPDRYCLLLTKDMMTSLAESIRFSNIDKKSAFNKLRLHTKDI